jgi:hypothetical protein
MENSITPSANLLQSEKILTLRLHPAAVVQSGLKGKKRTVRSFTRCKEIRHYRIPPAICICFFNKYFFYF